MSEKSISKYAEKELEKSNRWVAIEGEVKKLMKTNKIFRNKPMFLMYLVQESTWDGKSDRHNTWSNWYCNKELIVTSIGERKMVEDTGVPRSTIKRWLMELENDKLIRREYEWGELIVVVGKIHEGKNLYFYEAL